MIPQVPLYVRLHGEPTVGILPKSFVTATPLHAAAASNTPPPVAVPRVTKPQPSVAVPRVAKTQPS